MTESWYPYDRQLSKELRSLALSPFNRLCSIVHDATFVDSLSSLAPSVPIGGNARAGLWYVRTEKLQFECSFKSSDGHYRQWNFSFWRCNLLVLRWLVSRGAVFIIDTTRQGKKFPDSLSKTIPIWCLVMNQVLEKIGFFDPCTSEAGFSYLPDWVSPEERHWIEQKSKHWTESLYKQEEFISVLKELITENAVFKKPMRPIWVHRDENFSKQPIANYLKLPFLPIICVSVSSCLDHQKWLVYSCKEITHSFCYVQGAGDDEESWNGGLFPRLFWFNEKTILQQGPKCCEGRIKKLLEQVKSLPLQLCTEDYYPGYIELLQINSDAAVHLFWSNQVPVAAVLKDLDVHVHLILSAGERFSSLVDLFSWVSSALGNNERIVRVNVVDRAGRLESKHFGIERMLKEALGQLDSFLLERKQSVMIWCPYNTDWATCLLLSWLVIHCKQLHPTKIHKEGRIYQSWWITKQSRIVVDKHQLIQIFWWLSKTFLLSPPCRNTIQQMHRFLLSKRKNI
eukprot:jgi/Galph1/4451/GphlegSOOS_G3084.1